MAFLVVFLLIVPMFMQTYISSIVFPIIIFTGLSIFFAYRKFTLGIIINIYLHILAVINWIIMQYGPTDEFGFSNLGNAVKAGIIDMIGILILIVFIIVFIIIKANSKRKYTIDQSQPVGTIYCPHCGFPNQSDNVYCFKCNKNIK